MNPVPVENCQCEMCVLHRREDEIARRSDPFRDTDPFDVKAVSRLKTEWVDKTLVFDWHDDMASPPEGWAVVSRQDLAGQPFEIRRLGIEAARLPTTAAARKAVPVVSGCLDYFPDALAAVAALSLVGNEQHNPGEPLHWARGKSTDEADCIVRHLMDRGAFDTDGIRHSVKVAWRSLAMLQKELEEAGGLPISRGSRAG